MLANVCCAKPGIFDSRIIQGLILENRILDLLIKLDLVDKVGVEEFHPTVRDSDEIDADIKVMRCPQSGIIFLSRTNHIQFETYDTKEDPEHFKVQGESLPAGDPADDDRRAEEYKDLISGKDWLDFGAGYGWLLERLGPLSASAAGIEASALQRQKIEDKGFGVYPSVDGLGDRMFDVISLFHVFEHLVDPVELLADLKKHVRPGGQVIIEVPHARDILIDRFESQPFKDFTFWSEHLILHTRQSLDAFIREAGFTEIAVNGYQRYPLSNHLHWLATNKPGGHYTWKDIDSAGLQSAYSDALNAADQTDTLVAIARA